MTVTTQIHIPVLLKETLESLAVAPGGRYIDCTLGGGGHSEAILQHSSPGGQVLAIEADPAACRQAETRLENYSGSFLIVNDNFANLETIARSNDFVPVNGILFDLGLSSLQLGSEGSGFSFQNDAPLDMRFNPAQTISAADIVNTYPEMELANLIYNFGEEPHSRQIARRIVRSRPIHTTGELAGVIESAVPARGRIHPATRTFQALRIAVNNELTNLETALEQAARLLGCQGRLVVISYHSLEDRIVKNFMRRESSGCLCPPGLPECHCGHIPRLQLVNKRIITPSLSEVHANPRSRSAKMRVAEKLADATPVPKTARPHRSTSGNVKAGRKSSAKRGKLPVNPNMN